MKKLFSSLAAIALTVWVGGLWVTGYLAVPVLFHAQPDKQLAGILAGEIFDAMGYVGLVCGGILLLQNICTSCGGKENKLWKQPNFRIIAAMLVIGLIIQFGLSPLMVDLKVQARPEDVMHSAFADRFKMLHGVSSILYLLESLLGLYLVTRSTTPTNLDAININASNS
jgi:hypothetical protein